MYSETFLLSPNLKRPLL